jgi:LuxR family quorum-sensing system transcriptional regulator SinR
MPGLAGFNALVDKLPNSATSDPQAFLAELQAVYGLAHVLYADLRKEGDLFLPGTIIHAPDPDLERLLRHEGLKPLHPLFEVAAKLFGPRVFHPPDIAEAEQGAKARHRVSLIDRPLLVFPLVPSRPGVAFFACNPGHLKDKNEVTGRLLRDLAAFAGLFHAARLAASEPPPPKPAGKPTTPRLTPREREVLQWVAGGKTYWEIARILGISERTVRHFMSACREKLDAVSNKQAVAKAVAGGLIKVADPRFSVEI